MDMWLVVVILGIVEGATEFLPVSSSGHLILCGALLGFTGDKAGVFDVFIQLGAILAVVVLYRERFWGLLNPRPYVRFAGVRGILLLFLTCLPFGVLGLCTHDLIKHYLFTPLTVLLALVVGALCMLLVERRKMRPVCVTLDDLTPRMALGIGLFQCLSLWPGFSRSAATIMGGMLLGARRGLAAEYSFVAAVPIMVAAVGYDLFKNWHLLQPGDFAPFALGFAVAFVTALVAIKTFVALLGRVTLTPFAIYRLLLAAVILYFLAA